MSAFLDALEGRHLLTASLQAHLQISASRLFRVIPSPCSRTAGATDPQTFTVTSSNPDITASVAQGPFWTLGVSYNDASNSADNFTGTLTFQLFQNLTPNTVSMIEQFTNDGFYVNTGDYFPRIVSDFDSPLTTVIQGGATNNTGTGSSGQPNTPFANENVQELALTGVDQLALANAGGTDSNDTQFFINTGPADSLGYNYTVFGQLVAGQATLTQMATQVPVQNNPVTGEDSQPAEPLTITSTSLSSTSPDGVAILDATQAKPGETATITVTATDPTDGTTASQSFNVVVGEYVGPTTSSAIGNINFKPYASPVSASTFENMATAVQLSGQNTYPDTTVKVPLTYSLAVGPAPWHRHAISTRRRARLPTRQTRGTRVPTRSSMRRRRTVLIRRPPAASQQPSHSHHRSLADTTSGLRSECHARHEQEAHGDANRRGLQRASLTLPKPTRPRHTAWSIQTDKGLPRPGTRSPSRLRSAKYNTATDTVTLTPPSRLRLRPRLWTHHRRNVAIRSPRHRRPLSRWSGHWPGGERRRHLDLQAWRDHRVKRTTLPAMNCHVGTRRCQTRVLPGKGGRGWQDSFANPFAGRK